MRCENTAQLLSPYVDDVLSLPLRVSVDEHLNSCPVCRDEVTELRSLRRSLANLSRPRVPVDLTSSINTALSIEAGARRESPPTSFRDRISIWLEPRLMPYSVGSLASLVLFVSMFVALRPHFIALQEAARQSNHVLVASTGARFDLNQPVTPEDFSAQRAPFTGQSPTLNPGGALAQLTSSYAQPTGPADADDMIVVADVFSNGAASLADVVQAPRDRQLLDDFQLALRQSAAFVPASLDRRPNTMRVVFSVQKVDVHERSF